MKKKKTKKDISDCNVEYRLILMGIVILFFFFILPNWNEQEFTITKEICWEEPIYKQEGYNRDRLHSEIKNIVDEWKRMDCDIIEKYNLKDTSMCKMIRIELDKINDEIHNLNKFEEVCEQVEVEEKSLSEAWDICWNDDISEKEFVMCSLMETGKPLDFGSYKNNINWLDENCECLEKYNSKTNTLCGDCNGCEEFEYDKCYEYKCGDYLIKVK